MRAGAAPMAPLGYRPRISAAAPQQSVQTAPAVLPSLRRTEAPRVPELTAARERRSLVARNVLGSPLHVAEEGQSAFAEMKEKAQEMLKNPGLQLVLMSAVYIKLLLCPCV